MELETPAAVAIATAGVDLSLLIVLRASPEEAAAHERYLDALEKETRSGALWRRLVAQAS
ncbi:hypothetical protein D3C83_206230 [compost metagenome]